MLESWKLAPALASGMHGGAEAGRVHPAVGAPVGRRSSARPGVPDGRLQPRQRARRGGRRRAGQASGRAADLLHRREPHRAAHLRQRRAEHLKGLSMELGGKSPGDRVRRRRPRCRPRLDPVRRVLAQRRALHRRQPHPRRALASTTSSSSATPRGRRTSSSATRTTRRPRSARWCTPSTTTR